MSRASNKEQSGATPTQDAPCNVISDTRRKPFLEFALPVHSVAFALKNQRVQ
jgi:hypothetical protein